MFKYPTEFSSRRIKNYPILRMRVAVILAAFTQLAYSDLQLYSHLYKNNQTTSTKCQYQIGASKPKW